MVGLFGLEQGFQGFLVSLGFRPEQPGHRANLGRETIIRLSSHSQKE